MKKILQILCFLPLFSYAQQEKGIQFEHGLTWEQIIEKAKTENKYIFVDCYTTWCLPCKKMDLNVYPNDTVGRYMNEKFISIKVQMDTGKNDEPSVQTTYAIARQFDAKYSIEAFPTFLYFSPEGKAVHKGIGMKSVAQFIIAAKEAQNPDKQLYTLIDRWKQRKVDYNAMPSLCQTLLEYKEKELALAIARDYMINFLERLSDEKFLIGENLKFMSTYIDMVSTKDRVFMACMKSGRKIDSVMGFRGYSKDYVKYIITKEAITPTIKESDNTGLEPGWKEIEKRLQRAYGQEVAHYAVTSAKVRWYKKHKSWNEYTKYLVEEVTQKGGKDMTPNISTMVYLNNCAWEIFKYSKQKAELVAAIGWSDRAISIDEKYLAGNLDTKACLLYKLGNRKEAIDLEQRALTLSNNSTAYREKIEKMKNGDFTWVE